MIKVECGKCGGKGEIRCFSHVAGGTCFACGGKGYSLQKSAPKASIKFAISAALRETGEIVSPVFWINARSEAEAIRKATARISDGNAYNPDTVAVAR